VPDLLTPSRLFVARSPFRVCDRVEVRAPEGSTVLVMLALAGIEPEAHVLVDVDGESVERRDWDRARPRAGSFVCVRAIPEGGGGGGNNNKSIARTVALIAVVALAVLVTSGLAAPLLGPAFAAGTTGAIILGATISVAGQLAVNALIPPPSLRAPSMPSSGVQNAITGSRNNVNQWGVVPRVFGTWKIFPCYASLPFQEIKGSKVYYRQLFDLGIGPVNVDEIAIAGATLLKQKAVQYTGKMSTALDPSSAFFVDGSFQNVELEVRHGRDTDDPITIVDQEVHEQPLAIQMRGPKELRAAYYVNGYSGTGMATIPLSRLVPAALGDHFPQIRRTLPDATAISVDVEWPAGLIFRHSSGETSSARVRVEIEYQTPGAATWELAGFIDITAETDKPRLRSLKWDVTKGQYDVRLTRLTPAPTNEGVVDQTQWIMLRTHRVADFAALKGHGLLALSIMASNQLSGVIDALSVKVTSLLRKWNGSAWVETATGNNAAVFREILQARDNHLAIPDADAAAKIDLPTLQRWSTNCDSKHFSFNGVFDDVGTVYGRLKLVASVGRASYTVRDGQKHSVVEDLDQTTPAGWFGPRNSWGESVQRVFPEIPHALRTRWQAPELDYKWREEITYADGYSEDGAGATDPATVFEVMEFPGVDNAAQAWSLARYHLAVLRDRANLWTIATDPEGALSCERGDLVRLNEEFIGAGISTGRLLEVVLDGSNNCTGVVIDEDCPAPAGPTYGVRIRHDDFSEVVKSLASITPVVRADGGRAALLTFASAIAAASVKEKADDIAFFGVFGSETRAMVVKQALPSPDMNVRLVLVDDAPSVRTADQGPHPAWAGTAPGEIPPNTREPVDPPPAPPVVTGVSGSSGGTKQKLASDAPPTAPSQPAPNTSAPAPTPPKITIKVGKAPAKQPPVKKAKK
jgi:hypothetical protein